MILRLRRIYLQDRIAVNIDSMIIQFTNGVGELKLSSGKSKKIEGCDAGHGVEEGG